MSGFGFMPGKSVQSTDAAARWMDILRTPRSMELEQKIVDLGEHRKGLKTDGQRLENSALLRATATDIEMEYNLVPAVRDIKSRLGGLVADSCEMIEIRGKMGTVNPVLKVTGGFEVPTFVVVSPFLVGYSSRSYTQRLIMVAPSYSFHYKSGDSLARYVLRESAATGLDIALVINPPEKVK